MILTEDDIRQLCFEKKPPLLDGLIDPDIQIQPNGVDLSVETISRYQNGGQIGFKGFNTIIPETKPIVFESNKWAVLEKGCYLVTFREYMNMPTNLMAIGRPRSSLLRMGATVETAVWDAGFRGKSGSMLIIYNENGIKISQNARVIQLVFIELKKDTRGYMGRYLENK